MIDSNDLTNVFTSEGFLLVSIFHLKGRTTLWLLTGNHLCHLQQQTRPVWNTEEEKLDIFTCFPFKKKLVQAWFRLGVTRSGREPKYLPLELYLGQKEDDNDDNYDLNTCPPSHAYSNYYRYRHSNPQLWQSPSRTAAHMFHVPHFEEWTATRLQSNIIIISWR